MFCCSTQNDTCKSCHYFVECRDLALSSAKKNSSFFHNKIVREMSLEAKVDVVVSIKTRERLTEYQKAIINNEKFPSKARKLARTIFSKGINGKVIVKAIKNKNNPFNNTAKILFLACNVMIEKQAFTLDDMARNVEIENYVAAKSVAKYTIMALILVGAVVKENDYYTLRHYE